MSAEIITETITGMLIIKQDEGNTKFMVREDHGTRMVSLIDNTKKNEEVDETYIGNAKVTITIEYDTSKIIKK